MKGSRVLAALWWGGPLFVGLILALLSAMEGARYETSWQWIQTTLRFLCPEHTPTDPDRVQVQVTMYQINGALRRLAHVASYAVLTALAVRAAQRGRPELRLAALLTGLGVGLACTGVDELIRFFQPNRHAKWLDLALNLAGVGIGLLGSLFWFGVKGWERKRFLPAPVE